MKGELVVNATWRLPSDRLATVDIERAVASMMNSLTEVGLPPTTISGYSTEGGLVLTEGE